MPPTDHAVAPRLAQCLPNALSALRLLSAPLMAFAVATGRPGLAFGLFAYAVLSDIADGRLARRLGHATPLGGLLDHGADAAFVVSTLAALAWRGVLPALLPLLVAAAFAQYALDSHVGADRPLRASRLGRWNGIAYYVLAGTAVVRDGLGLRWPPDSWLAALGWLLVTSTLASMVSRLAPRSR
jgi:phosphatidylglycerophosphate synthase